MSTSGKPLSIWWWAFGYFASYVPYSALTKALSSLPHGEGRISGLALLPWSTITSLVVSILFLLFSGWWRDVPRKQLGGFSVPVPSLWPALSGLASSAIIATTTLSYSFAGTSIVLMMLFMRGGVLLIAPVVDFASGRKVKIESWVALFLTLAAVTAATAGRIDLSMGAGALTVIGLYLAAYFVRLRLMSHSGKNHDPNSDRRYFAEEQFVALPSLVLLIGLYSAFAPGQLGDELRNGFTQISATQIWAVMAVGFFSQGTGLFGALVLLNPRENSYCVPVNRASSIIAGVMATAALALFWHGAPVNSREMAGAALVLLAITVLASWKRAAVPVVAPRS